MIDGSVWLGIGIGGALGALGRAACLRQMCSLPLPTGSKAGSTGPRLGLLVANTLGCFGLGVVASFAPLLPDWLFLALATGFCGALTTFSTLCAQLVQQWHEARGRVGAAIQLGLNLGLGYAALFLGLATAT